MTSRARRRWPVGLAASGWAILVAMTLRPAAARTMTFSGYTWLVNASPERVDPGPNLFSDSSNNVWVDRQGRLHLKITHRAGIWECAEVTSQQTLGYGVYRWVLDSRVNTLDPNVVLGLFSYSSDTDEVDIEFSRWGEMTRGFNTDYVVQPAGPGQLWSWNWGWPADVPSTHSFVWSVYSPFRPGNVRFRSWNSAHAVLQRAVLSQPVPPAMEQRAHMNLWLYQGQAPLNEAEVIIRQFDFFPT